MSPETKSAFLPVYAFNFLFVFVVFSFTLWELSSSGSSGHSWAPRYLLGGHPEPFGELIKRPPPRRPGNAPHPLCAILKSVEIRTSVFV